MEVREDSHAPEPPVQWWALHNTLVPKSLPDVDYRNPQPSTNHQGIRPRGFPEPAPRPAIASSSRRRLKPTVDPLLGYAWRVTEL